MRVALALFAVLMAAPALAQEDNAIAPEVLALFPQGMESCYAAAIGKGSMKSGQSLTDLHLYRLFDPDPAKENVAFTREEAIAFDKRSGNGSWTDVVARFKGEKHPYTQVVTCSVWDSIPGKVTCGVECDGGFFTLAPKADGVLLEFPGDSGGLSLNASCGEPDEDGRDRWMTAKDAGGAVLLKRSEPSACAEAEAQVRAAYTGDRVPLRERIDAEGWRCLSRTYDKAHLAKHPRQMVTAMAVEIAGPAVTARASDSYNETTLEVAVTFRLRDGSVITRPKIACHASDHEFGCEGGFRLRRKDERSAYLIAGDYDPEPGEGPVMLDRQLGSDDTIFRLDAGTAGGCRVD